MLKVKFVISKSFQVVLMVLYRTLLVSLLLIGSVEPNPGPSKRKFDRKRCSACNLFVKKMKRGATFAKRKQTKIHQTMQILLNMWRNLVVIYRSSQMKASQVPI